VRKEKDQKSIFLLLFLKYGETRKIWQLN